VDDGLEPGSANGSKSHSNSGSKKVSGLKVKLMSDTELEKTNVSKSESKYNSLPSAKSG